MGRSSLLGIDRAELEPSGRDTATLGPGDTSDSGSDMAGIEALDNTDPSAPIDVALADDVQRTYAPIDSLDSAPSDASGTGERRSAGSDAGLREAADISVDRVFDPDDEAQTLDEDEDPDLDFVDRAEAGAVLEDEDEADADDVAASDALETDDAGAAADAAAVAASQRAPDAGGVEGGGSAATDAEGDVDGADTRLPDGGIAESVEGEAEDTPESDVERSMERDIQQGGARGATRR